MRLIMGILPTVLMSVLFSMPVYAVPILLIDADGQLTGATGVDVDGSLYDVEFVDGTCTTVFTICEQDSFAFKTNVSADLAGEALLQHVFLDVAMGAFDSDPSLTNGCERNDIGCEIFTPFNAIIDIPSGIAVNFPDIGSDRTGGSSPNRGLDLGEDDHAVWARWSVAVTEVPEPSTLALLGAGLLGLFMRRKRVA